VSTTASRLRFALLTLALLAPAHAAAQAPPEPLEPPLRVAPIALKIPAIGVEAEVVPVGEDPDGAMTAPPLPHLVAWWSLGYGTGEEPANVVFGGHVNWDYGRTPGAFAHLERLQPSDEIVVVDELAREYRYAVASTYWTAAEGAPVAEIFAAADRAEITLITCGGAFDPVALQYLDRLIVRAVKV
jgi:sortase (surface protein transpeptidase)